MWRECPLQLRPHADQQINAAPRQRREQEDEAFTVKGEEEGGREKRRRRRKEEKDRWREAKGTK